MIVSFENQVVFHNSIRVISLHHLILQTAVIQAQTTPENAVMDSIHVNN